MNIIIAAAGSDGDINPMIEVSQELASRGHNIAFVSNEHYRSKVQALGLRFVPLGDEVLFKQALAEPDLWHPTRSFSGVWRHMRETLQIGYDVLAQTLDDFGGDATIIATTMAISARILQEVRGVRLVTMHLSPCCILSRQAPPAGPGFTPDEKMPKWLKDLYIDTIEKFVIDRVMLKDLNRFRKKLRLKPIKNAMGKWIHSPDSVVCAFPQWFAQPQTDWPPHTVCTDFPLYSVKPNEKISQATEDFLQRGAPPIVFTAGSAMAHSRAYFAKALKVISEQKIRSIFVSRFTDQIPADLPEYVHHSHYEPFDLLFKNAAVIAHHGGIGTTAQALNAGKPQLILPFGHDQFDNAARVVKLGCGIKIDIDGSHFSWRQAIEQVTMGPSFRSSCDRARQQMADHSLATSKIADAIEKIG